MIFFSHVHAAQKVLQVYCRVRLQDTQRGPTKTPSFRCETPPNFFVGGSIWNHCVALHLHLKSDHFYIHFEWILPPIFPGKTMFGHQNMSPTSSRQYSYDTSCGFALFPNDPNNSCIFTHLHRNPFLPRFAVPWWLANASRAKRLKAAASTSSGTNRIPISKAFSSNTSGRNKKNPPTNE